jgi:hypothetical protein
MRSCSTWFGSLAVILLVAGPSLASDSIMTGQIKSIDATNKTFVLTDLNNKDHTLKLSDHVTINRGGKDVKGDLKAGDRVNICIDSGVVRDTAMYILVLEGDMKQCALLRVTIKGFDASKKEVTFTDTANDKSWTFALEDAKVNLNGQSSSMQNLKIGDPAVVILDRSGGINNAHLKAVLAWRK